MVGLRVSLRLTVRLRLRVSGSHRATASTKSHVEM